MKKSVLFLLIILLPVLIHGQNNEFNCFSVLAGKDATASGAVMAGHNEDDHGKNIINLLTVDKKSAEATKTHMTRQGEKIRVKGKNKHGFLWIEMPGQDFAGSYVNDNGVVIFSNACPSKEDRPELTNGGIGFMFRRVLAENAGSAREALEIAGRLIEKYGYDSSGRTYTIADKKEAWVLAVVNGKHWVAQRVPDNEVVVIPNYYTITEVRLEDSKNFMGSKGIIEYAVKRGWYDPEKDGKFNFRKAYGKPGSLAHPGNIARKWQGLKMITGKSFPMEKPFPFSVKPQKKLTAGRLMQIMGDHYEGTEFDASNGYQYGNPHDNPVHTICAGHNQYSMVVELKKDIPKEMGVLMWIAFRRPCTQPFLPIFTGLDKFPSSTRLHNPETALKKHLSPEETLKVNGKHFFTDYIKFSAFTDNHYTEVIDKIREYKKERQRKLFQGVEDTEATFQKMYRKSPEKAKAELVRFTNELLKGNRKFMHSMMEKHGEN
ncbi:MAG: C69 family dipeptidase [Bacteroidales bacterium]